MQVDVEALLAPVSIDGPMGPDLTYDDARTALDESFEAVLRDDYNGDEPDWRKIANEITALLSRSKDVWLGVYLCRAGARLGDLDLVLGGAQVLAGLLEQWEDVHPSLDELGPQGRKSPCDGLGQRRTFLTPLEACPLISDTRHGRFAAADLDRITTLGESAENYIYFTRAMAAGGADQLATAEVRLAGVEAAFKRVDETFSARAPVAFRPDLSPLFQSIRKLRKTVAAFIPSPAPGEEAPTEVDPEAYFEAASKTSPRTASAGVGGQIASREDVTRALDAICDYYRRFEPASPVPLALQRARSWVTLDFLALLKDIAPESLNDARRVLTLTASATEGARED